MFARDRTNDTLHRSQAVAVVFTAVAFVVGVGVDARISAKQYMECVLPGKSLRKVEIVRLDRSAVSACMWCNKIKVGERKKKGPTNRNTKREQKNNNITASNLCLLPKTEILVQQSRPMQLETVQNLNPHLDFLILIVPRVLPQPSP